MKWFKHFSRAHEDRAVEKLILEFGYAGYGLYFYCLEIIAGTVDPANITFELEPDIEILAYRGKMDTLLVGKIMHRCIELGLFELADNGRITCLKLGKFIEKSSTSNKEMRSIIGNLRYGNHDSVMIKSPDHHDSVMTESPESLTRLDEIRLEKEEKKKESPSSEERHQYGSEKNVLLTDSQKKKLEDEIGAPAALACIEHLSKWKAMKGKTYKRDDLAIRQWVMDAMGAKPLPPPDPTCPLCGRELCDNICINAACPQYEGTHEQPF